MIQSSENLNLVTIASTASRQAARLPCGHIPLHCHLLWKLGTTRYQELYYRGPLLIRLAKYHHQILDIKCKNTLTLYYEDSTHKTSSNEP